MTRRRSTLRERLLGATEGVARVYRFTFMHSGWAHFTVNDATGELSIQSDWGDYSYRWNINAIGSGATLTEFLANCDTGYLTRKLIGGLHRDERLELDVPATRRGMVKWTAEQYRDGVLKSFDRPGHAINRHELKVLYREIGAFVDNAAYDVRGAYDFPGEYVAHYFEDLHEWFVCTDTARVCFLADELLPLFLGYLRGEVKVTV